MQAELVTTYLVHRCFSLISCLRFLHESLLVYNVIINESLFRWSFQSVSQSVSCFPSAQLCALSL